MSMRASRFLSAPMLAVAALASSTACGAAIVQPVRWSLRQPVRDLAALAGANDRVPDAASVPVALAAAGRAPDRSTALRIAPSVSNILDSRRSASYEETGVPGGGDGYVRAVRRTIGIALRKPFF